MSIFSLDVFSWFLRIGVILLILLTCVWWYRQLKTEDATRIRPGYIISGAVWSVLGAVGIVIILSPNSEIVVSREVFDAIGFIFSWVNPLTIAIGPRIFFAGLPQPRRIRQVTTLHMAGLAAMAILSTANLAAYLKRLEVDMMNMTASAIVLTGLWVVALVWVARLYFGARMQAANPGRQLALFTGE